MKLFGTDGIRGTAGEAPLDRDTVARVGAALVRACGPRDRAMRVLVGRDTRESGVWIEQELARGLAGEGADVTSAGVLPTPAVAYLTKHRRFDAGIVISASHNPFEDNGIKIFGSPGEKLGEATERDIERIVHDRSWQVDPTAQPRFIAEDLSGAYLDHARQILGDAGALHGSRIVLDCANGATAGLAPPFFHSLGFRVDPIGVNPDGRNINLACGSTHLDALRARVVETGARLGIAFDGDGDRALFVDHAGTVVDGDAVLLMAADQLKQESRLAGDAIVATVMSNIGLEIALRQRGITMVRCQVGDKYVMEEMQRRRITLGGEQSGHVIFADHLMTGDGIGTALQVLRVMAVTHRELAALAAALVTYPQILVNVRVRERADYLQVPAIANAIAAVERRVNGQGRVLIRYSGTEPLLRIMIEGKDQNEIAAWAGEIAEAVRANLA
ncbi:MAG TPA: phosphoglucosamine mutase [Vicinamibacterales bacterium]|nr:phosphoglucosamine mutase [Vicinamibacterales bacterium]